MCKCVNVLVEIYADRFGHYTIKHKQKKREEKQNVKATKMENLFTEGDLGKAGESSM